MLQCTLQDLSEIYSKKRKKTPVSKLIFTYKIINSLRLFLCTRCPSEKHKSAAQVKSRALPTEKAETLRITAGSAHGARPRRPCESGRAAPQYVEAGLGFSDGREGGSWGRRSLGSPGRAAIFAKGKETGLRGSNF